MKTPFDLLQHYLSDNVGMTLSSQQLDLFWKYLEILQDWNQRMNLVADAETETIIYRHFLDSLTCLQSKRIEGALSILDLGAGAGFPGIPLKIAVPQLNLTVVESIQKKCRFLEQLIASLKLDQTRVVCARAESMAQLPEHREQYNLVITRALAELAVAAELALPFVALQGTYIAMLGNDVNEQIATARMAISLCGGIIELNIPIELPQSETKHYLLLIRKTVYTPDQYPRRVGIPQKRPLIITR
jgi:16S rRNA (guanine527-N7)-methyltransferase